MKKFLHVILPILIGLIISVVWTILFFKVIDTRFDRRMLDQDDWLIDLQQENQQIKQRLDELQNQIDDTNQLLIELSNKMPAHKIFDIPLSLELQEHTQNVAWYFNFEPEFIFAIMEKESGYNPHAENGNAHGIMQIDPYWTTKFVKRASSSKEEKWNLYDPYDCISLGIGILYYYREVQRITDEHQLLMAYNGNSGYLQNNLNNGIYSTPYSRGIINRKKDILNNN
jgi:soluble lytic murein transglycosylase-like protein